MSKDGGRDSGKSRENELMQLVAPIGIMTNLTEPFLNPCYSQSGLWTSSVSITWEFVQMQNLSPPWDPLHQNLSCVHSKAF